MAEFPPSVVQVARSKAAELENFDGGNTTNFMDIDPQNSKDSMETNDQEQAIGVIKDFLRDFKKIPMTQLTPEQTIESIQLLKQKYLRTYQHNLFLVQYLSK